MEGAAYLVMITKQTEGKEVGAQHAPQGHPSREVSVFPASRPHLLTPPQDGG